MEGSGRTLKRVRTARPDPQRQRLYRRSIWIAVGGNALLAASKGAIAVISRSSALFSDAANSSADTLYAIFMAVGLYLTLRPPDESHPQGHSRFEPFVALFIALVMISAGVTALWQSVERFIQGAVVINPLWPTVVLALSAVAKLAMFRVVGEIGRKTHSPAIQASARDNLADVAASSAALIGVWGSRLIRPVLDPMAGLLVALWIFRSTRDILQENFGYLTGRGAAPELSERIVEIASAVEGVDLVHRVISDYVGPQLRIDMHINVDGHLTLEQAHAIGEEVQMRVAALPEVDRVFVHVEPTREPPPGKN
jgi:cation diffusion facilitator family transporter